MLINEMLGRFHDVYVCHITIIYMFRQLYRNKAERREWCGAGIRIDIETNGIGLRVQLKTQTSMTS